MPKIDFQNMPPHARLWVFSADRALTESERDSVLAEVDVFLETWAAHGVPLTAARHMAHDRFLLVAVDEQAAGVSGCSIDALVRSLKKLEADLDLTLLDHAPVSYRDNGSIRRATRAEFSDLVDKGGVTLETTVFNNTVASVGDFRDGKWEARAQDSWHADAFFA